MKHYQTWYKTVLQYAKNSEEKKHILKQTTSNCSSDATSKAAPGEGQAYTWPISQVWDEWDIDLHWWDPINQKAKWLGKYSSLMEHVGKLLGYKYIYIIYTKNIQIVGRILVKWWQVTSQSTVNEHLLVPRRELSPVVSAASVVEPCQCRVAHMRYTSQHEMSNANILNTWNHWLKPGIKSRKSCYTSMWKKTSSLQFI